MKDVFGFGALKVDCCWFLVVVVCEVCGMVMHVVCVINFLAKRKVEWSMSEPI